MSRFTGLKKHLPPILCPCSIFSCHDSCHNTLCTLPLSCRSLVSGVQSSWLGDPGFSSDTMTYYCKVQNKSADVLEGRKIYGKLQPTTKFCPWKLTTRKSGTHSLICLMKYRNDTQLLRITLWSSSHPEKLYLEGETTRSIQAHHNSHYFPPFLDSLLLLYDILQTFLFLPAASILPSCLLQSSTTVQISSLMVGFSSQSQFWLCSDKF